MTTRSEKGYAMKAVKTILDRLNPESRQSFCLFDLDGTLTDSNTTYEFVGFMLRREYPARYLAYRLLRRPLAFFTDPMQMLFKPRVDLYKVIMIRLLDGIPKRKIHSYGLLFSRLLAKEMRNGDRAVMLETLERLRHLSNVFIVTRSIDPVQHLQQLLEVVVVTSDLRYDEKSRARGLGREVDKGAIASYITQTLRMAPYAVVSDDDADLMDVFPFQLKVLNSTRRGRCHLLGVELREK